MMALMLASVNQWSPTPHRADWTAIYHVGVLDHPIPTIWIARQPIKASDPRFSASYPARQAIWNRVFVVRTTLYRAIDEKTSTFACRAPNHLQVTGEVFAQSTNGHIRTICLAEGQAACGPLSELIDIASHGGATDLAGSLSEVAGSNGCWLKRY
jgi:hypothetical protein